MRVMAHGGRASLHVLKPARVGLGAAFRGRVLPASPLAPSGRFGGSYLLICRFLPLL